MLRTAGKQTQSNPIQTQNKPNSLDAQMNVSSALTKDYENERLCRCGENKPKQTQFLKILDNLSIITSAPFLTGLDYFLFCEDFAGEIIGKGNLHRQRFFKALDFVGYLKSQSVINRYNCGKPELF